MPIRCRAEHDDLGIMLSRIESIDNALSLRCFLAKGDVSSAVGAATDSEVGFRLFIIGLSLDEFKARIAGSNIELI
jgi:hypothetical protein